MASTADRIDDDQGVRVTIGSHRFRVAIIEDDPATRVGLSYVVGQLPALHVVAAEPSVERFEAMHLDRPDLVVLDLRLRGGGLTGRDAVQHLCSRGHRVLVISVFEQEAAVLDAIGAGASGYLTKEAEPEEITRAAIAVATGKTYFSATVAGYVLREPVRLTRREKEILRMVASGETASQIARQLYISEKTVNGHLDRIRDKTGCRRKADLTRFAVERGIVA